MMDRVTGSLIGRIGETAGEVWRTLDADGPMSPAKLARRVAQPRDMVMQAIGWLAREGKVEVRETRRGRLVSLK